MRIKKNKIKIPKGKYDKNEIGFESIDFCKLYQFKLTEN